MKRNIILLLIINLSLFVCAKQRTLNEVYQLAQNFFTQSEQISTRMSASPCLIASSSDFQQKMNTRSLQSEENAFYIFNNDSQGFVIISGDDRMTPILAYSDSGPFILDNIPNYIVEYLLSYLAELEYINESDGNISEDMITSYIEIEEGINSMEPSSSFIMSNKTLPSTIAPLLGTIKWGQGAPFNELCPIINGTVQALTGCVATAMAQIMKYYQYPTKGIGSKTYTTETQNITCSFDFENTSFDYSLMLPQYIEDEYTNEQAAEVAKLMSACGVAVSMNYKTSASGAYASNIPQAMIDYFNYDSDMYYLKREYFLYDEWMELIKSELSEGRPIMYSGIATGGHQFIFDGYDSDNLVHVNWGWSGKNDGYFMVTKLQSSNPGVEGEVFTNTGYTNNQAMIVGVRPAQDIPSTDNKTLLYCERITVKSGDLIPGETMFSPTIINARSMSKDFDGEVAFVLEKNGIQRVIGTSYFATTAPVTSDTYLSTPTTADIITWSDIDTNFTIPTDLEDGSYLFYPASRSKNSDSKWNRIRGQAGCNSIYKLNISNNGTAAKFYLYWTNTNVPVVKLEALHDIYEGRTLDLKITYSNAVATTEYYGIIKLGFIANKAIRLLGTYTVYMKAKQEEVEEIYSITLPSNITAGEYEIIAYTPWGTTSQRHLAERVPIEVNAYDSSTWSDITLIENYGLSSNSIEEYEPITVNATFTATGSAPIYDDIVRACILNSEGVVVYRSSKNLFFKVNTPTSASYELEPELTEGNYRMAFYKKKTSDASALSRFTDLLPFTVSKSTGVIENNNLAVDAILCFVQDKNTLYIKANDNISCIEFYDVMGHLLSKERYDGADNEKLLSISDLRDGVYIVLIKTRSKIYKQKIIRK